MKRTAFGVLALAILGLAGFLQGCAWLMPEGPDFDVSSTEGFAPLAVGFTPRNDASVVAYAWDFGDGDTSVEPEPVHIYRAAGTYTVAVTLRRIDGGVSHVVKADLIHVGVLAQKAAAPRLYWIDWRTNRIMYGTRSGSEFGVLIDGLRVPTALATGGEFIYWADSATGSILRAKLDGTDRETVLSGLHRPAGLAVDTTRRILYCVTHPSDFYTVGDFEGTILAARLDGTDKTTLLTFDSNAKSYADEIAVDPEQGRIYWTVIENLLVGPADQPTPSAAGCIGAIAATDVSGPMLATTLRSALCDLAGLALDTIPTFGAERVYWSVASYSGRIVSCKVDGTGWQVVADDLSYPTSVAVDRLEGKIYFASEDGIQRMNLDGTSRETIFPGVDASAIEL